MKICFINNRYGVNSRGGTEKIIETLTAELVARGNQVTIICGSYDSKPEEAVNGVHIIYVASTYQKHEGWPLWRRLFSHIFGFINIASFLRFKKIVHKERYDLIWTHNVTGFGLILLLALGKAHQLHTFHDIQFLHPSGLLLYKQEKKLDTFIARVYRTLISFYFNKNIIGIFPSQWLLDLHKKYGFDGPKTIHLVNPIHIDPTVKAVANGPDFLFVGQIEAHKGVELLLESFQALSSNETTLWIVGEGSLKESLAKKYSNENIKFLGKVDSPLAIIKSAQCLVVPSLCYENFPTVILEAQSLNTLVIGSRLGGIIEAIDNPELTFIPEELACLKILEKVEQEHTNLHNKKMDLVSPSLYLDQIEKFI